MKDLVTRAKVTNAESMDAARRMVRQVRDFGFSTVGAEKSLPFTKLGKATFGRSATAPTDVERLSAAARKDARAKAGL